MQLEALKGKIPKLKIPEIKLQLPITIAGIKTNLILSVIGFLLNLLHFGILLSAFILMAAMLATPLLGISTLAQEGLKADIDNNKIVFNIPLNFQNFLPLSNEIDVCIKAEMASGYEIKTIMDLNKTISLAPFETKNTSLTKSFGLGKFAEIQSATNSKIAGSIAEKNIISTLEIEFELVKDVNKGGFDQNGS